MAVVEIENHSSLKVKLDLGMVYGKTRSKSYSSLKYDASAQLEKICLNIIYSRKSLFTLMILIKETFYII
jgi:hypothetical protein